ncbi:unnamed protein product, partial [Leptidea sinapis]
CERRTPQQSGGTLPVAGAGRGSPAQNMHAMDVTKEARASPLPAAAQKRYLLKALDQLWHEDCLKCGCCDCRLGEVGHTLYTRANLILCKRDYLRLFGNTGYCAACNKVIPAFEMVMRARSNVYHLECFACQQCNHSNAMGGLMNGSSRSGDHNNNMSGSSPAQFNAPPHLKPLGLSASS